MRLLLPLCTLFVAAPACVADVGIKMALDFAELPFDLLMKTGI